MFFEKLHGIHPFCCDFWIKFVSYYSGFLGSCQRGENCEPQANEKFFDPAIFQKCWRGSGRVALIAARRQRNPCTMLLAHGGGGEKSDSFSRRGEQDRSALWNLSSKRMSCNCSGGTVATKCFTGNISKLLLGKPSESGSARLGHIPSLPWESQLPLKPCILITTSRFLRQLRFAVLS